MLALGLATAPAQAEGIGAEADYARANGGWGTEIGAGYALGIAGFRLTPGAGVYIRDGDTDLYGRIEATVALPMTARIGAGVRFSADDPRPYATIAMPLLPKVAIKANAGPKYVSLGLTLGY
ncbi:hypothetical protein [Sphingobium nicotianae]|uniref:Uncharacterized protein n=1 Tax=Sphingobium nicotianae TaxID=2782607 RepID=A0A9X1DG48_9SPHN|nr:hypothetical protein [Sphingobium nicotianae]MBT2189218.1 hypothetical protein [Sphingobium nicotianae]